MISIFIIVMLASVVIFALVIVLGVFIIKKNINDAKISNQTQIGYQPTNNQNYINGNFNGGYNYQNNPNSQNVAPPVVGQSRFCSKCGAIVTLGQNFCPNCGEKMP